MSKSLGVQVLERTIKLFEQEDTWTQGYFARSFWGLPGFSAMSRWAKLRCWDAGLLFSAYQIVGNKNQALLIHQNVHNVVDNYVKAKCGVGMWQWNDTPGRTREEIVDMLREILASILGPKPSRPPKTVRNKKRIRELVPA